MSYDLVIYDMHDHPEDDFKRQEALGNLILEERPRSFIMGGDGSRHDAFSTYDKYKQWTAQEEIHAWHHSLELMFSPLRVWNEQRRKNRHKQHPMRSVLTLGNHEDRMWRALAEDPYGFGSLIDFDHITGQGKFFDEVYEFGDVVDVNGIFYTHAPRNKMNRVMAQSTAAKQSNKHLIYGHTHTGGVINTPIIGPTNGARTTMIAPAFMNEGQKEPYCKNATTGWTYGLLKVWPSGSPDVPFGYEFMRTEKLLKDYL